MISVIFKYLFFHVYYKLDTLFGQLVHSFERVLKEGAKVPSSAVASPPLQTMQLLYRQIVLFALTVIMTASISAAKATPWLGLFDNMFEFPSQCDTASFDLNMGNSRSTFHNQDVRQCNTISTGSKPTVHLLRGSYDCSYKLIAYSGYKCQDETKVNTFPLNPRNPSATLGSESKLSVCSYRLGNPVRSGDSIQVRFGGGGGYAPMITHDLYRKECYNICRSRNEKYFPEWVGVYNYGNVVHDNYIELFSQPYCEEGSEVRLANGRSAVQFERLDAFSHLQSRQVIRSFMIVGDH